MLLYNIKNTYEMELEAKSNLCVCQSSSHCQNCESKQSAGGGGLDSAPISAGGLDSATSSSDKSETIKISFGRKNSDGELIIDHILNRKLACEKSDLIKNALDQDPNATVIIKNIAEFGFDKEFQTFVNFLPLTYHEIERPFKRPPNIPSHVKCEHIREDNCGGRANYEFINNFFDKKKLTPKGFPEELKNTIALVNYLGAKDLLYWVCAKAASISVELGLIKSDINF